MLKQLCFFCGGGPGWGGGGGRGGEWGGDGRIEASWGLWVAVRGAPEA